MKKKNPRKRAKADTPTPRHGARTPVRRRARAGDRAQSPASIADATHLLATRELYWHNVIREILTSLSAICTLRPAQGALPPPESPDGSPAEAPDAPAPDAPQGPSFDPSLFDGRLAVVTRAGERVAIADVFPLYACGISHPGQHSVAHAVECTVFQIRTPGGHVYTLPLHEIRCFHALTPELMAKLERVERRRRRGRSGEASRHPFGFAAYTSLIKGLPDALEEVMEPPSEHPME